MSLMMNSNHSESPEAAQDMQVCGVVHHILNTEYPDHPWRVGVCHIAGTIIIDLLYKKPRHLQRYAYQLHLKSLTQDGNVEKIKRAGGELLERFQIPRSAASPEAQMKILTGQITFDGSNPDA